jgi:hypothetical protein
MEVARKSQKPFDNFTQQQGAIFLSHAMAPPWRKKKFISTPIGNLGADDDDDLTRLTASTSHLRLLQQP